MRIIIVTSVTSSQALYSHPSRRGVNIGVGGGGGGALCPPPSPKKWKPEIREEFGRKFGQKVEKNSQKNNRNKKIRASSLEKNGKIIEFLKINKIV